MYADSPTRICANKSCTNWGTDGYKAGCIHRNQDEYVAINKTAKTGSNIRAYYHLQCYLEIIGIDIK